MTKQPIPQIVTELSEEWCLVKEILVQNYASRTRFQMQLSSCIAFR